MSKFMQAVKVLSAAAVLSFGAASAAQAADVLRVGTEATYAPFEFMGEGGKEVGYDMDIIRAVGEAAGF